MWNVMTCPRFVNVGVGLGICAVVCCVSFNTAVSAVEFTEIARFNVDSTAGGGNPEFIGSNPGALAWSGTQLYLGGWNNSGGFADISLIEVLNATSQGIISEPTYSGRILTKPSTPAFWGFNALDLSGDGTSLGAAYDDGAAPDPFFPGFFVYNTVDNTERWSAAGRGSSGVSFDPGFPGAGGADAGTAFGKLGSGRRLLYDTQTGAQIYDASSGLIWFDSTSGTGVEIRDMDFDPVSGDIYARHNNLVSGATRSQANGTTNPRVIVNQDATTFVGGQNLSFLSNTSDGDLIIYNSRSLTALGQPFADVIRVIDVDGTPVAASFTTLDGLPPDDGNAWYDFDFDPASQTLAILDFANRNVHIFQVGQSGGISGDFNNDGFFDLADIDALISVIASGGNDPAFDLTGDGVVDLADRDAWLVEGGAANAVVTGGNPFLVGDANLDGSVDVSDFNAWNGSKFTAVAAWGHGDFNADGSVDVSDFNLWNGSKFQSSSLSAVPEPSAILMVFGWLLTTYPARRRRRKM